MIRNGRADRVRRRVEIVIGLLFFGLIVRAILSKDMYALLWSMVEIGPVLIGSVLFSIMNHRAKCFDGDLAPPEAFVKRLLLALFFVFCLMIIAVLLGSVKVIASIWGVGVNVFMITLIAGVLYCTSIALRVGEFLLRFSRRF